MSHPRFDLPAAEGYVVAFSGGADSRLLLELTVRTVVKRYPDRAPAELVIAAHLNHGIRGEEADRDEAFCRTVCANLGIPLAVEHADVPALARESGQSEETTARHARYAFLTRVMQERHCAVLLTAHNANDQLETVLYHLLRGSGTRGMGGIPAMRALGSTLSDGTPLYVHRPLLGWTREDILAAVQARNLAYVTDSTNLADACTRNRLRHHVTPTLEAIAGRGVPQSAARRLAQAAREDDEVLSAIASARYEIARRNGELSAAELAAAPPAIGKRMIALAYAAEATLTADTTLSAYHLNMLLSLCRDAREGVVSNKLPGGRRAAIRQGRLIFETPTSEAPAPVFDVRPLPLGETRWDAGLTICVERFDTPTVPASGGTVYASAIFPADALPLPLSAKGRTEGEHILSRGMTKKVKKLLCDKHIHASLRNRLPRILTPDGELLWLPGVAFRDGYPPPTAGPCLRVTVRIHTD